MEARLSATTPLFLLSSAVSLCAVIQARSETLPCVGVILESTRPSPVLPEAQVDRSIRCPPCQKQQRPLRSVSGRRCRWRGQDRLRKSQGKAEKNAGPVLTVRPGQKSRLLETIARTRIASGLQETFPRTNH